MDATDPRYIARTNNYFARSRNITGEQIRKVENIVATDPRYPIVKPVLVTDGFLCTEVWKPKGIVDPPHLHMDHEAVCYLISGKVKLIIGDQEFIAEPGDYWCHPKGVMHYTEILEESVNIEIKIPPIKTWNLP